MAEAAPDDGPDDVPDDPDHVPGDENPAPRLRALFVNENLGGHAALHRHLAAALDDHPAVAARFVDVPRARLPRRIVAAAVPGLARLDVDLQPLRAQLAASAVARRLLRADLDRHDVIHVYSQNAALLWPRVLRERPSVVATDGTNEQNAYTLPYRSPAAATPYTVALTRRFETPVYSAATLVVAQSDWARRSLVEHYGVAPERVRVVRYGIPIGPAPARTRTELPEVTFVGTTMERKGGYRLLDSFRRTLRGRAVLNLVTPEAVAPEEGVRVHNDVRPGDGKLDAILSRSALFAFPSSIDKSSFAVMEAMAAGVPALVLDAGGLAELVEDGVSGWVIDDSAAALDHALVRAVDDLGRCEQMGMAARLRAKQLFDASVTTGQVVEVLREAVERFAAESGADR